MKYIDEKDFCMNNTCVAFGDFDGIHLGHRAVIDTLLETSKQGLTPVVVSFEYDEANLNKKKILATAAEKQYLLNKNGPEVLISYKISEQNKDVPVKQFIKEVIVGKLGAKVIVAGADNCDITVLRECAKEMGYTLVECATVLADGKPITAERIVAALAEGSLDAANNMLGHPYLIIGEVMHGKAIGRTVGMPTANIGYGPNKQLPADGVFGTISEIDGKMVKGLTNIGKRPSVDNFDYVTIEDFLLDFSGDLYGKVITLDVHVLIRGVQKFKSIDEVKAQVNKDIESIRAYLDKF